MDAESVHKQPALAVAAYRALPLASLLAFGAERGAAYARLRNGARKPTGLSCLDLVTLLRKEMGANSQRLAKLGLSIDNQQLVSAAAA